MKIMIINGSPRKSGATAYILHRIEEVLSSMGVEVIFYNLIEQKMALCNGCCVCYKTGYCVYDDDAENISKQIYNIDGLVIGSSTIASNVPGVLKSFIDRGHFVVEQLLYDKYTLCVATYENYGGYSAFRVLKNLVTLSGSFLTGKIVVKLPFNSDYSSIPKLNKVSEKYALRLHKSIKEKKQYNLQKIKRSLVINIGLKQFVLRKGNDYNAVQKRWRDIGLF